MKERKQPFHLADPCTQQCSVNVCGRTHEQLLSVNKGSSKMVNLLVLANGIPFSRASSKFFLAEQFGICLMVSAWAQHHYFQQQVPFLSAYYLSRTVFDTRFFSNQFDNIGYTFFFFILKMKTVKLREVMSPAHNYIDSKECCWIFIPVGLNSSCIHSHVFDLS